MSCKQLTPGRYNIDINEETNTIITIEVKAMIRL